MTQTIATTKSLYEQDLNLWLETAIAQLKAGDLKSLDIENLIEELEGLAIVLKYSKSKNEYDK